VRRTIDADAKHPEGITTPMEQRAPAPLSTYGMPPQVALRTLLEAGVHFGHQTKRWNPKMKPYIFTARNGIHIIDLQQTVGMLQSAHDFVTEVTARGGRVLFIATKKQAQDIVEREAVRSNQFFVNQRWLGGTLTNFVTIRARLRVLKQLQAESERGEFAFLPKQEAAIKLKDLERLERTLGGMRDMTQLPGAIFVIDPKREHLAIHEARRLGIPVIAVTDTNSDPDDADFLIPGNDDAIRAVRLLAAGIADAAIQGQMRHETARTEQAQAPEGENRRGQAPVRAEDFERSRGGANAGRGGGRRPAPVDQPAEVAAGSRDTPIPSVSGDQPPAASPAGSPVPGATGNPDTAMSDRSPVSEAMAPAVQDSPAAASGGPDATTDAATSSVTGHTPEGATTPDVTGQTPATAST